DQGPLAFRVRARACRAGRGVGDLHPGEDGPGMARAARGVREPGRPGVAPPNSRRRGAKAGSAHLSHANLATQPGRLAAPCSRSELSILGRVAGVVDRAALGAAVRVEVAAYVPCRPGAQAPHCPGDRSLLTMED